MEKRNIKRLPIARGKALFGIVVPSNFFQAVGSLAHEITADLIMGLSSTITPTGRDRCRREH